MASVLQEFVEILVSGIVQLAQGIASGVVAMAKALFLETATVEGVETVTGLSIFGGIVAIFAKAIIGEVKSRNIGEGLDTNTEITYQIA